MNYFRDMDGGQEDEVTVDSKEIVAVHSNGATRINFAYVFQRSLLTSYCKFLSIKGNTFTNVRNRHLPKKCYTLCISVIATRLLLSGQK